MRERRDRLEAEIAECEAVRKEIAEERKRPEAAETEADLQKDLLEEETTSEAKAARLQAEIAEMEGGGLNDAQRTLAETQATRDMIERASQGERARDRGDRGNGEREQPSGGCRDVGGMSRGIISSV